MAKIIHDVAGSAIWPICIEHEGRVIWCDYSDAHKIMIDLFRVLSNRADSDALNTAELAHIARSKMGVQLRHYMETHS